MPPGRRGGTGLDYEEVADVGRLGGEDMAQATRPAACTVSVILRLDQGWGEVTTLAFFSSRRLGHLLVFEANTGALRLLRAGPRELPGIARHRGPLHEALVPRRVIAGGAVEDTAVVPDDQVAFLPLVAVAELGLGDVGL